MNLGGARDRPDLGQVWENCQARHAGQAPKHTSYSKLGFTKGVGQRIFGQPVGKA